jgi:predicted SprT family Zn-dependent metalloprotease
MSSNTRNSHNELVKAVEEGRPINPHKATEQDPEPPTPAAAAPIPSGETETAGADGADALRMPANAAQAPKAGVSRERAEEIIRAEMNKHGLIAAGWTFRLGRASKQFGLCDEKRKLLTFSQAIAALNTDEDLREVVCHEIAHAKVGNAAGHGRVWRAMALACGANPERACGAHIVAPDGKYHATCSSCGHVTKMTRAPKHVMCCDSCVRKHLHPFMSLARKIEIHDKFTLIWTEQATGRTGRKKEDFERAREEQRPESKPVEQRGAEPEVWNVKPITNAAQPNLF